MVDGLNCFVFLLWILLDASTTNRAYGWDRIATLLCYWWDERTIIIGWQVALNYGVNGYDAEGREGEFFFPYM